MPKRESPMQSEMLQGTLDMLVLRTLVIGPAHGHTIAHTIERGSEAVLQIEHGSLYPALHRLENRGWVQRSPDPADGRYTLAMLTEPGLAKVVAAAPGHVREVRRLVLQPLTRAQLRQLAGIAARISVALSPDGSGPPWPAR